MVEKESSGWFSRLKLGLEKSSEKLTGNFKELFLKKKLDNELLASIQDLLIQADLGVASSRILTEKLAKLKFDQEVTSNEVKEFLAEEICKILSPIANPLKINLSNSPHVILVCGVNGSGKTTTIGKLANQFVKKDYKTVLVAGDTFRAAAVEQLQIWGDRAGCKVMSNKTGSDPASLAFDALNDAIKNKVDVLMIDTAGRLQNRVDLMAELEKIIRVLKKIDPSSPHDIILVMDSTIGQNAHNQVDAFNKSVDVSGLVITKLDGSAKGGVVVALAEKFGINIHAVGVGEGISDLQEFEPSAFSRSLLNLSH